MSTTPTALLVVNYVTKNYNSFGNGNNFKRRKLQLLGRYTDPLICVMKEEENEKDKKNDEDRLLFSEQRSHYQLVRSAKNLSLFKFLVAFTVEMKSNDKNKESKEQRFLIPEICQIITNYCF